MKNKILKNEPVEWRACQWLQTKTFKDITEAAFERLIASMLKLDYISNLKVWCDKKGVIWILDGHHRQRALKEIERRGHEIQFSKMDLVYSGFERIDNIYRGQIAAVLVNDYHMTKLTTLKNRPEYISYRKERKGIDQSGYGGAHGKTTDR